MVCVCVCVCGAEGTGIGVGGGLLLDLGVDSGRDEWGERVSIGVGAVILTQKMH